MLELFIPDTLGKFLYVKHEICYSFALLGRLVQLVRILGRHPRGRGFEFLTAHHTSYLYKSEKDIRAMTPRTSTLPGTRR